MDAVQRINTLFPKYLDRQITETEWEELLVWMSALSEEELADLSQSQKYLWEKATAGELPSTADKVNWDKVLENILATDVITPAAPVHRVHFLKTSWFRYAAAVVLLAGGAAVWYEVSSPGQKEDQALTNGNKQLQIDIAPGSNKAVLTIGNKTIDLASNKTGVAVANDITYSDGSSIEGLTINGQRSTINVLSTPRGGQYQAVLPDGSKVWLNAASRIKFPSKFTGNERSIEITGEAYLEIAKNTKQPFFVHTNGIIIEVLGTSFNINAYPDEEAVKTTLVEGAVKILKDGKEVVLKPGQQARTGNPLFAQDDNIKVIPDSDTNNEIAWVKGYFYFDKADVKTILRQISRWYDLDIVYSDKVPEDLFSGKIERNIPLSGILRFLDQINIKVRAEGKKLIVL
jgi:hypothetical protein